MELKIKSHKDLDLWKMSIKLVTETYNETKKIPEFEKFALISQMHRASISIASNIAEGASRETKKEFIRFLYISRGSCSELETQFLIAKELGYLQEISSVETYIKSLKLMINGLIKKLRSSK